MVWEFPREPINRETNIVRVCNIQYLVFARMSVVKKNDSATFSCNWDFCLAHFLYSFLIVLTVPIAFNGNVKFSLYFPDLEDLWVIFYLNNSRWHKYSIVFHGKKHIDSSGINTKMRSWMVNEWIERSSIKWNSCSFYCYCLTIKFVCFKIPYSWNWK